MFKAGSVFTTILVAGTLTLQGVAQRTVVAGGQAVGGSSSANLDAPSPASVPVVPAPATVIVTAPARSVAARKRVLPFSKIAISTKSSTLGAGGQIAVPLMRSLNLRGGADFFNFGAGATLDGARYEGQIHLKNGQVSLDWFPFNLGFHISPGFVIFKSALSASVYVPGGTSFDLGSNTFTSSTTDPVFGTADIVFSRSIMPSLTMGFGNMIAKEGKHWSVPFEVGLAYTGHYTAQLNLRGSACISVGCMSTSSATIQKSIVQEEDSLNEPMKHYQIYPIVTSGLSYRF